MSLKLNAILDKIPTFARSGMKGIWALIVLVIFTLSTDLHAQTNVSFHSNGKIYLVIGVLVTIFLGIIFFLVYLERKLNKLEKQINDNE